MSRKLEQALGALLLVMIGLGSWYVWQRWIVTGTVSREEDGDVVSRVVESRLANAQDLRVKTLTGVVQGAVCVDRMWKILHPCRVMKAPFRVDYFVDVGALDRADFRWNETARTLIVNAPEVRVGTVNVDESRTTYDETSGVWVSRDAMTELRRKASVRAHRVTADEANKPGNLDSARRNARAVIARQFALPLEAAGMAVTVRVRFPSDRVRSDEQWDVSRPLREILGDRAR